MKRTAFSFKSVFLVFVRRSAIALALWAAKAAAKARARAKAKAKAEAAAVVAAALPFGDLEDELLKTDAS